jgi:predicted DsbA family dithiol-disulfide isomerase
MALSAPLQITEFTDPGCPFAFSAEPLRLRILWQLGEQVEWTSRMIVLSESPQDYLDKGLDAELLARSAAELGEKHGMPISGTVKDRPPATRPACAAVVAARVRAPERSDALLRDLRVRNFSGALLDEPDTLAAAATSVGIDADALLRWVAEDDVIAELERDMHDARHPVPAARALDHKLAGWSGERESGRRYTAPSLIVTRTADGASLVAPGFQPWEVTDVLVANLLPGADRRPAPEDVTAPLRWAEHPLATQEVAVICDIDREIARERLREAGAVEHPVAADAYWSLA